MKKIKIAFDLDGVIIDKPPLISKKLLERLFKGGDGGRLHYRFPHSKLEQKIRKFSHYYLWRPPIKRNIEFIKKLSADKKYEIYIISGRYSFLENETNKWLSKREINCLFKDIYLNLADEQPYLFKEKIIKKINPDIFIDDDGTLVDYLSITTSCQVYCFGRDANCKKALKITDLKETLEENLEED
jgi:hypothetical protein